MGTQLTVGTMASFDTSFDKGEPVRWDWGTGEARGTIAARFERKVIRKVKDSLVTRYGTPDNPAYLVRQDNGDEALKLGSELKTA